MNSSFYHILRLFQRYQNFYIVLAHENQTAILSSNEPIGSYAGESLIEAAHRLFLCYWNEQGKKEFNFDSFIQQLTSRFDYKDRTSTFNNEFLCEGVFVLSLCLNKKPSIQISREDNTIYYSNVSKNFFDAKGKENTINKINKSDFAIRLGFAPSFLSSLYSNSSSRRKQKDNLDLLLNTLTDELVYMDIATQQPLDLTHNLADKVYSFYFGLKGKGGLIFQVEIDLNLSDKKDKVVMNINNISTQRTPNSKGKSLSTAFNESQFNFNIFKKVFAVLIEQESLVSRNTKGENIFSIFYDLAFN